MDNGKDVGRKRKFQAFAEDKEHCGSIHAKLTSLLDKRVQEVDAYVANELQVLKEREHESLEDQQARLISIQDREAILAARNAELESMAKATQQREAAIDAKSAELHCLRAELLQLYERLRSELPELQARASLGGSVQSVEQVTATSGEKGRSRLDLGQLWSTSPTVAAQPRGQEQQKASVGATGVWRERHEAATGDACPQGGSAASAPGSVMDRFHKLEEAVHTHVSASRCIQPVSPIQVDASRGQPSRPAMPEACNSQQEQIDEFPPPPALADVDALCSAACTQRSGIRQPVESQQEHAQSGPKQRQSLPAQTAQNAQRLPEHKPYAQQWHFRPVVQQQRAASKHNADPRQAMNGPVTAGQGQRMNLAEKCSMSMAPNPRKTPVKVLPAQPQALKPAHSQPARVHNRLQQGPGKARNMPCSRTGAGGTSVRGEVDELEGLVTSLRAQCPIKDEPGHSNDIPHAASRSGDQQRPEKPPAESFTQTRAPDLVNTLKAQHSLSSSVVIQAGSSQDKAETVLYEKVHGILTKYMTPQPGPKAEPDDMTHSDNSIPTHSSKHTSEDARLSSRYSATALGILAEAAQHYQANGEPVTWGWCTELDAFVFVFETANRIVVEEPKFSHATYFFEIEEPLAICCQVQRLIAVLSVPSIGRSALLRDKAPCFAKELPSEDKAVLLSAGWTEEDGLRALLNFSGERVVHMSDKDAACTGETWERYRERLRQILSQGRAKGRLHKSAQRSA